MDAPPERIELPAVGVVLRRHRPTDLDALHAAIEESRDHLRPFMPFADQARVDTAGFLELAVDGWDEGSQYNYLIVDATDGDVLGGCGIHRRVGPDAADIGYWLRATATGRGIVTAAAEALTEVGLALDGVERMEIHCDEANVRSAAVPRRLGYRLDRIEPDAITSPGELGRMMVWVWSPT
ncbi:MAG: GNAT family N-acetyltransferase [Ilumatobacteraceae bacterium]